MPIMEDESEFREAQVIHKGSKQSYDILKLYNLKKGVVENDLDFWTAFRAAIQFLQLEPLTPNPFPIFLKQGLHSFNLTHTCTASNNVGGCWEYANISVLEGLGYENAETQQEAMLEEIIIHVNRPPGELDDKLTAVCAAAPDDQVSAHVSEQLHMIRFMLGVTTEGDGVKIAAACADPKNLILEAVQTSRAGKALVEKLTRSNRAKQHLQGEGCRGHEIRDEDRHFNRNA